MLLCCLVLKISRLLFPSHGSQNLKCTCAASMKLRTLLFQSSSHGKDQSVVLQNTFYKGCDAPHQSTRQKRKSHAEQISDVRVLMPYHLVRSICLHESSLPMTVHVQLLFCWAEGGQHPTMCVRHFDPNFASTESVICKTQWSMVNACTPQGEPIFGHRR